MALVSWSQFILRVAHGEIEESSITVVPEEASFRVVPRTGGFPGNNLEVSLPEASETTVFTSAVVSLNVSNIDINIPVAVEASATSSGGIVDLEQFEIYDPNDSFFCREES